MPEQTEPQTEIEKRLLELPEDVREAVLSAHLGEQLREIGQKHNLHIDQIGLLEDETMLVMLGFFEPETFSEQIATQLRISSADASAIAQEVNTQVFLPIRESMKRFTESKRAVAAAPATTGSIPVVPTAPMPPTAPAAMPTPSVPTIAPQQSPALPVSDAGVTKIPVHISQTPASAVPPPPAPPSATEKMLTEPTVAKPIYKADPYREPIEP